MINTQIAAKNAQNKRRSWVGVTVGILLLLYAVPARSQTGTPMPVPIFQGVDNAGNPVANGRLCTYVAGTTTPAATYTSSALNVANTPPPTGTSLDSAGRAVVFLTPGQSFKFVLLSATSTDCSTGTTIWTVDGILAVPSSSANLDVLGTAGEAITAGQVVYLSDGSGAKTAGQWFIASNANSYSSTTGIVGMAPNAITSGTAGTIRLAGQMTGLTSLVVGSSYYASTGGTLASTASTNRRFLGVADSTATLQLATNPPPLAVGGWTTVTTTATGTQNDFAPGLIGNTVLRCNNATLLTITGLAGGYDTQRVLVESVGAGEVDTSHQDTSSTTAADRLINFVTKDGAGGVGKTPLAPGSGLAEYVYDGTTARWRLVRHEQGAQIDYTATSTIVGWTSFTSGRKFITYQLRGNLLFIHWHLEGTSNSTSASFTLPFTTDGAGQYPPYLAALGLADDNGVVQTTTGVAILNPASNTVNTWLSQQNTAWTNAGTKISGGMLLAVVQ